MGKMRFCFIVFMTATLFSCFPVIYKKTPPEISRLELPETFLQQGNRVLVLPVWAKSPVMASSHNMETEAPFLCKNPFFINMNEVSTIGARIPSTVNFGLASTDSYYGKHSYVQFIYLISDSGQIVKIYPVFEHAWIGSGWKSELLESFEFGIGQVRDFYDSKSLWRAIKQNDIEIFYSEKEYILIKTFLQSLPVTSDGTEDCWRFPVQFEKIIASKNPFNGDWPKTVDEAVEEILHILSDEDKSMFVKEDKSLLMLRYGFGISNRLGLYRGNEELLISACGQQCDTFDAEKVIIEAIQKKLKEPS